MSKRGYRKHKTPADLLQYTVRSANGCDLWQRGVNRDGYGEVKIGGRQMRAHRAMWEFVNGRQIPDGLQVMHSCDTPACINPDHLSLGTSADNHNDMKRKGRGPTGDKNGKRLHPERYPTFNTVGTANPRAKINETIVAEIRKCDLSHKEAAAVYGLHRNVIRRIRVRELWKHVP